MTAGQLDALAQLLRMHSAPALAGARLVLVEGMRPADAARQAGISGPALHNALARLRAGRQLARQAVGM